MARELLRRENMQTAPAEYLGALITDERRLVLVTVDPDEPWEAFRALRRRMRKEQTSSSLVVDIFESPSPIEHEADVIPLASRRRAG